MSLFSLLVHFHLLFSPRYESKVFQKPWKLKLLLRTPPCHQRDTVAALAWGWSKEPHQNQQLMCMWNGIYKWRKEHLYTVNEIPIRGYPSFLRNCQICVFFCVSKNETFARMVLCGEKPGKLCKEVKPFSCYGCLDVLTFAGFSSFWPDPHPLAGLNRIFPHAFDIAEESMRSEQPPKTWGWKVCRWHAGCFIASWPMSKVVVTQLRKKSGWCCFWEPWEHFEVISCKFARNNKNLKTNSQNKKRLPKTSGEDFSSGNLQTLMLHTRGGPCFVFFFSEKKPVKCWGWMLTAAAWVFRWDDFPMVLSWVWTLVWWTFGQIAM